MDAQAFYRLIAEFGDAGAVFSAAAEDARLDKFPAALRRGLKRTQSEEYIDGLFTNLELKGVDALSRLHPNYPAVMQDIYLPPPVLYIRGRWPIDLERAVAVVGSRRPTRYGLDAAFMIGRELAAAGITVVSGLARGIDARAHEGALSAGGSVAAVLGCGVDVVYPREHERLYAEVAESGCLISEYPPGTRPLPGNFPARNRIISGLSRAAVVVEAGIKSGALITAGHALAQGRDVYAVPGSIFSPACEGSNRLLADGAHPLLKTEDILVAYGWGQRMEKEGPTAPDDPVQKKIFGLLRNEPLSFDSLSEALGVEAGALNSILTIMELSGIITQLPGRVFTLPRV
jgi:DNA processing protein